MSRNTKAKTAILELINSSSSALTQVQLQEKLNGLCDRVTIYRVLERLVKEQKIHRIATGIGAIQYASCTTCDHHDDKHNHNHEHLHFTCEKCHATHCLSSTIQIPELPTGYLVHEHLFTLKGICPACNLI